MFIEQMLQTMQTMSFWRAPPQIRPYKIKDSIPRKTHYKTKRTFNTNFVNCSKVTLFIKCFFKQMLSYCCDTVNDLNSQVTGNLNIWYVFRAARANYWLSLLKLVECNPQLEKYVDNIYLTTSANTDIWPIPW